MNDFSFYFLLMIVVYTCGVHCDVLMYVHFLVTCKKIDCGQIYYELRCVVRTSWWAFNLFALKHKTKVTKNGNIKTNWQTKGQYFYKKIQPQAKKGSQYQLAVKLNLGHKFYFYFFFHVCAFVCNFYFFCFVLFFVLLAYFI
jgi:hypothetical protein